MLLVFVCDGDVVIVGCVVRVVRVVVVTVVVDRHIADVVVFVVAVVVAVGCGGDDGIVVV